jgi:hypothetical protein
MFSPSPGSSAPTITAYIFVLMRVLPGSALGLVGFPLPEWVAGLVVPRFDTERVCMYVCLHVLGRAASLLPPRVVTELVYNICMCCWPAL